MKEGYYKCKRCKFFLTPDHLPKQERNLNKKKKEREEVK